MADDEGTKIYERITDARRDPAIVHPFGMMLLTLDALELLFRPPSEATDEKVNTQYETMEEAAFAVARAAKTLIEETGKEQPEPAKIVGAYGLLREEVAKYKECEEQYEGNWQ